MRTKQLMIGTALIVVGVCLGQLLPSAQAGAGMSSFMKMFLADDVVLKKGGDTNLIIHADDDGATSDAALKFKTDNTSPTVRFTLGVDSGDSNNFKLEAADGLGGANPALFVQGSDGNIALGTTSAVARLTLGNTAATSYDTMMVINTDPMAGAAGTPSWVIQGDENYERLEIQSLGGGAPSFQGAAGGGTLESPTASTSGQTLFQLAGRGWDNAGTPTITNNRAIFRMETEEAFTTTAQGTRYTWLTTAPGTTSTSEKMRLNGNGNLGIGTNNPTEMLHIENTGSATIYLQADSDNVTESDHPQIVFEQDGGAVTGYLGYSDSTNHLRIANNYGNDDADIDFMTQSLVRMTIDGTGNVGIGSVSPTTALDVSGTVTATAFSGSGASLTSVDAATLDTIDSTSFLRSDASDSFTTGTLTIANPAKLAFGATIRQMLDLYNSSYGIGVQSSTFYSRTGTNFAWFKGGSHAATAFDPGGGTLQMALNTNGNLGIGTSTIGEKLVVAGNIVNEANGVFPHLVLDSTNAGDVWTSQGAYISLGESGDLGAAALHMTYRGDGYGFIGSGAVANAEPGSSYFRFDYNANHIYTPDNIGIGSETPGYPLDVTGNIRASNTIISTTGNGFRNVAGNYGLIYRNDGAHNFMLVTDSGDQYGSWNSLRPFYFNLASGDVTLGNGALTAKHGANVGIGSAAPAAKLDVNGNIIADDPTASNHVATKSYVDAAGSGNFQFYMTTGSSTATAWTDCLNITGPGRLISVKCYTGSASWYSYYRLIVDGVQITPTNNQYAYNTHEWFDLWGNLDEAANNNDPTQTPLNIPFKTSVQIQAKTGNATWTAYTKVMYAK